LLGTHTLYTLNCNISGLVFHVLSIFPTLVLILQSKYTELFIVIQMLWWYPCFPHISLFSYLVSCLDDFQLHTFFYVTNIFQSVIEIVCVLPIFPVFPFFHVRHIFQSMIEIVCVLPFFPVFPIFYSIFIWMVLLLFFHIPM
jgi:hypothetical protein